MKNLLFCAHTQCMSYLTDTFLLVRSSVWSKQLLCFVHGQGQKSEQKPTTMNFVEVHNHSPLLTMVQSGMLLVPTELNHIQLVYSFIVHNLSFLGWLSGNQHYSSVVLKFLCKC